MHCFDNILVFFLSRMKNKYILIFCFRVRPIIGITNTETIITDIRICIIGIGISDNLADTMNLHYWYLTDKSFFYYCRYLFDIQAYNIISIDIGLIFSISVSVLVRNNRLKIIGIS